MAYIVSKAIKVSFLDSYIIVTLTALVRMFASLIKSYMHDDEDSSFYKSVEIALRHGAEANTLAAFTLWITKLILC